MIKFKNWPTDSRRITSPFGPRWGSFHDGVDIGGLKPGVEGDRLYAVDDGVVVVSKVNGGGVTKGYGYYVVIQYHGFTTLYGHMQKLEVHVGQKVKAGQVIGHMGNTGTSTAAHLHFRVAEGNYNGDYFRRDSMGKTYGSVNPKVILDNIEKEVEKVENKEIQVPEWAKEAWEWATENGINDGKVDSMEEIRTMCYLYRYHQAFNK